MALPVLRSTLDGYNSTVFAFGQTGSGKTFTITGGAERYADRGLIPRALSALFAEAAKRSDHTYAVHVSCMGAGCRVGCPVRRGGCGRTISQLQGAALLHMGGEAGTAPATDAQRSHPTCLTHGPYLPLP